MYNSIIEFIKNDTTKIEKITKKFLLAGNTLQFEENLVWQIMIFAVTFTYLNKTDALCHRVKGETSFSYR